MGRRLQPPQFTVCSGVEKEGHFWTCFKIKAFQGVLFLPQPGETDKVHDADWGTQFSRPAAVFSRTIQLFLCVLNGY